MPTNTKKQKTDISKNKEELIDPAQKLYNQKNTELDLKRDVDSYAMWAFWLSVSAPFFIFMPFFVFLIPIIPFVCTILSLIAIYRISHNEKLKGMGYAITALVISLLEIMVFVIILLFFAVGIASIFGTMLKLGAM